MDAQHILSLCPRQPHEYLYLLLDPLSPIAEDSPLHAALSQAVISPRADLAHTPAACPHLITLGTPSAEVDLELLAASLEYALEEMRRDKRVVCGWLSSDEGPLEVAQSLADHCVVRDASDAPRRLIPLFEPRRLELMRLSAPSAWLAGWLGPITHWVYLDTTGNAHALAQNARQAWDNVMPESVTQAQRYAPVLTGLLNAWQTCLSAPLPPDASRHALTQLSTAVSNGLDTLEAQLAFCLNRLYPQGAS